MARRPRAPPRGRFPAPRPAPRPVRRPRSATPPTRGPARARERSELRAWLPPPLGLRAPLRFRHLGLLVPLGLRTLLGLRAPLWPRAPPCLPSERLDPLLDRLDLAAQLLDLAALALLLGALLLQLVEQHGVEQVVADGERLALLVELHQAGIDLRHLLGDQPV